jgi:hypothetical protein
MKNPIPDEFCYSDIPLGIAIKGKIGRSADFRTAPQPYAKIYRVLRGNGSYGTKPGKRYQQKYDYFIPATINHPNGQPARDAFKTAVDNWYTKISQQEKDEYIKRAKKLRITGCNLYIKEYIKANL